MKIEEPRTIISLNEFEVEYLKTILDNCDLEDEPDVTDFADNLFAELS